MAKTSTPEAVGNGEFTIINNALIALVRQYGEEAIVNTCNKFMVAKAKQVAYHKAYNARKNFAMRQLREVAKSRGLTIEQLATELDEQ